MNTLDGIEREQRQRVRAAARTAFKPRFWIGFLVGAGVAPFASAAFLFIPFMGQALVVLGIVLTVLFVIITRRILVIASGLAGGAISITLFTGFATKFNSEFMVSAYAMLGFAALVIISYSVFILGAIWSFYDSGVTALQQASTLVTNQHHV